MSRPLRILLILSALIFVNPRLNYICARNGILYERGFSLSLNQELACQILALGSISSHSIVEGKR
jgi:hypothetical protein